MKEEDNDCKKIVLSDAIIAAHRAHELYCDGISRGGGN
jgi:hypothetical protein